MVDFASITAGLKAAEAGLGVVKALRDADYAVEKSELKLKVAELMDALANTKIALVDSRERIAELEAELVDLQAIEEMDLKPFYGMYVKMDGEDKLIADGPFCGSCKDGKGLVIRIHADRDKEGAFGRCGHCSTKYRWQEFNRLQPGYVPG